MPKFTAARLLILLTEELRQANEAAAALAKIEAAGVPTADIEAAQVTEEMLGRALLSATMRYGQLVLERETR
jgi:hypothetical protein